MGCEIKLFCDLCKGAEEDTALFAFSKRDDGSFFPLAKFTDMRNAELHFCSSCLDLMRQVLLAAEMPMER